MADKKLWVIVGAKTTDFEKGLKTVNKQLKELAQGMTIMGAAITASLGMMVKAAAEEQANIMRLSAVLKNVGVDYDNVKASLEGVIDATQRKTGIADDQQRDALSELVTVTGNYQTALSLLPLTLDMAAAKQMDLSSAATLVGRIALGNTEILARYGIVAAEGSTATEILAMMTSRFGGTAEAVANPLDILKSYISDLGEAIGGTLLPAVRDIIDSIVPVVQGLKAWIDENPELAKQITMVVGAFGVFMTVVGGGILLLPKLAGVIHGVRAAMTGVLGPIGIIISALAFLFVAWQTNLGGIREVTEKVVEAIVHAFGWLWDKIMTGVEKVFEVITMPARALAAVLKAIPFGPFAEWGQNIENGLDSVTQKISDFHKSSVNNLNSFDVNFSKSADVAEESAGRVVGAVQGMTDGSLAALQGMTDGSLAALQGMTDGSLAALREYEEEVKKMTEAQFGRAIGTIAEPVGEGFVNATHRATYEAEAAAWLARAQEAAAGGRPEEAGFAGTMAAQALTRLGRNPGIPDNVQQFAGTQVAVNLDGYQVGSILMGPMGEIVSQRERVGG